MYISAALLTTSPHATLLDFRQTDGQTSKCIQIIQGTSIIMMLLLARLTADN